jgi:hypothetical protein
MADEPISALTLFTSYSTADEVEILDVSDTTFASTGTNKRIQFSTLLTMAGVVTLAPGSSTRNVIQPTGNYIPLAVEASASQTLHLQEWQAYGGSPLAYVDSAGNITGNGITAGQFSANGNSTLVARTGTGIGNGLFWYSAIQNTSANDGVMLGYTSTTYTTGSTVAWLSNNNPFLRSPSGTTLTIGQGSSSNGAIASFSSTGVSIPNGSLSVAGEIHGPIAPIYTALTGAATLTASQDLIAVSAASAGWTLTLPAAASVQAGHEFAIKKTDNNSNLITVAAAGSDKIDGSSTYTNLAAQYKYLRINSDGAANWMVTGSN